MIGRLEFGPVPAVSSGTGDFSHYRMAPARILLLCAVLLILASGWERVGAASYNFYDLGTVTGDSNSLALAINSSGQIAGFATVTADVPVFWTNRSSAAFELSQAGATFRANGLNNAGQIVGGFTGNQGWATFWTNSASPAFYLDGGSQPRSEADAINSAGEIVGRITTPAGLSPGDGQSYPCFWTNNGSLFQTLGYLYDTNNIGGAHAINDSGEIVGETGRFRNPHAKYWANSSSPAVDLGTLGGTNSAALSINAAGKIVGIAYDSNELFQAAYWANSTSPPVELLTLGHGTNAAECINNLGEIVGSCETAPSAGNPLGVVAVLWTNFTSAPVDLNTLIPANSGWILAIAYAINDSGEIVGFGIATNNGSVQAHAFALVPVNPNPPTLQFNVNVNQLTLGWPTNLGWILQVQTNSLAVGLTPTKNWYDVPGSGNRTNMAMTINATNPVVFYRLRSPNVPQ